MKILQQHLFTSSGVTTKHLQDRAGVSWTLQKKSGPVAFITPVPTRSLAQYEQDLAGLRGLLYAGSYLIVEHEGQVWKWIFRNGYLLREPVPLEAP